MKQTSGLKLKKPEYSEQPDIMDINDNMDTLDAVLSAINAVLDGNFKVTPYTIEGEDVQCFKVQSQIKGKTYTIAEIRAPEENSEEATLALMLPKGDGTNPYFVDLSMLTYGGRPRATFVLQTRGGQIYPFYLAFNDGSGAYVTTAFRPDGTLELLQEGKADPEPYWRHRKLSLGGLGYLQDRLRGKSFAYSSNHRSCWLYNCYYKDEATNTLCMVDAWVDAYRVELGQDGLYVYKAYSPGDGTKPDFTDDDMDLLAQIDAYGVRGANTLIGSKTYDPPSLAAGEQTTTAVTVQRAAIGDFAQASFSLSLQGIVLFAEVTATNTVTVTFWNRTGGTIDLASGTLRVRVVKA